MHKGNVQGYRWPPNGGWPAMTCGVRCPRWLRICLAIFTVGVVGNYLWEASQAFLFVGMVSIRAIWWHCFIAALGDGIALLVIHMAGWIVFRRADWFIPVSRAETGFMLGMGLAVAVGIEWFALHVLQRWAYTDQMPIIPYLAIGLTPVLQMLVLPPLTFRMVGKWCNLGRKPVGP